MASEASDPDGVAYSGPFAGIKNFSDLAKRLHLRQESSRVALCQIQKDFPLRFESDGFSQNPFQLDP
ncbi:hypothetical protein AGMMS49949_00130 [Alphaproteobacteria bacterium]|nr:hypothetical protein AGMMS49949_00130 [Alphaproteobacteria bacterium]GHS95717.1 hypothetical protein AGMMS50296_0690 [Alphaproteobacteria bacterium]